jgi:hypothetical protein
MRRVKKIPRDYFGNLIEVGDAYFYGEPPTAGKITAIKGSTIVLTYYKVVFSEELRQCVPGDETTTMNCYSPERGVCLDKTYDKKIT